MTQILIEIAKQRSPSLQLRLAQTTQSPGAGVRSVVEFFVISASPFQRPVMGLYHLITPLEKGSSRVAVVKVSLESVDSSE